MNLLKQYVKYSTDDPIQTKPVSIPHTTNMLNKNVIVDKDLHYFATHRKHNYSSTAPTNQVLFVSNTLQFQHNTTTNTSCSNLKTYQVLQVFEVFKYGFS